MSNDSNGFKCPWPAAVQVTYTSTPQLSRKTYGESLTINFIVDFPTEKIQIIEIKIGSAPIGINGNFVSVAKPAILLLHGDMVKLDDHGAGETHEGLSGAQVKLSKDESTKMNKVHFSGGKLIPPRNSNLKYKEPYPLDKVVLFQWETCP